MYTTKIKKDYYAPILCRMLCKDHNVILAVFKSYNVKQRHLETLFLPFTVNELKLDSDVKEALSPILLSAN